MDFNTLLGVNNKDTDKVRNKFLARVFGIFNEEIVRIWCNNPDSPFEEMGRPTISSAEKQKPYTLDFTFRHRENNNVYIVELKSWIEYDNHRYLKYPFEIFESSFINKSPAFKAFLDLAVTPENYQVIVKEKDNKRIKMNISGSILILPVVDEREKEAYVKKYHLHNILSLENIINQLIIKGDAKYKKLLGDRKRWFDDFINGLLLTGD